MDLTLKIRTQSAAFTVTLRSYQEINRRKEKRGAKLCGFLLSPFSCCPLRRDGSATVNGSDSQNSNSISGIHRHAAIVPRDKQEKGEERSKTLWVPPFSVLLLSSTA